MDKVLANVVYRLTDIPIIILGFGLLNSSLSCTSKLFLPTSLSIYFNLILTTIAWGFGVLGDDERAYPSTIIPASSRKPAARLGGVHMAGDQTEPQYDHSGDERASLFINHNSSFFSQTSSSSWR